MNVVGQSVERRAHELPSPDRTSVTRWIALRLENSVQIIPKVVPGIKNKKGTSAPGGTIPGLDDTGFGCGGGI